MATLPHTPPKEIFWDDWQGSGLEIRAALWVLVGRGWFLCAIPVKNAGGHVAPRSPEYGALCVQDSVDGLRSVGSRTARSSDYPLSGVSVSGER